MEKALEKEAIGTFSHIQNKEERGKGDEMTQKKYVRNVMLAVFFAVGYIAFLVVVIYSLPSLTPPYDGPPRTPVPQFVSPWGF